MSSDGCAGVFAVWFDERLRKHTLSYFVLDHVCVVHSMSVFHLFSDFLVPISLLDGILRSRFNCNLRHSCWKFNTLDLAA